MYQVSVQFLLVAPKFHQPRAPLKLNCLPSLSTLTINFNSVNGLLQLPRVMNFDEPSHVVEDAIKYCLQQIGKTYFFSFLYY